MAEFLLRALRVLPIPAAVLALAPAAAAAGTVDRTLSCPVLPEGEAHMIGFEGSVTTSRGNAYFKFWPTPLAYDEPAVLPGVEIDTDPGRIVWDPRGHCTESHARPALTAEGLHPGPVVTTHFVGSTTALCHAGSTQVLFRARIVVSRGEPTHAQVVAVDARTQRRLGYADWTPRRTALWLVADCEASG